MSGTPTTGDAGNHVVSLVVRDAGGLTDDQEFTVTAADEFPELGSITGQIFDDQDGDGQVDEGEGVAGASVTISVVEAAARTNSVITGANGDYRFDNVLAGRYPITVSAPGSEDPSPVPVIVEKDTVAQVDPIRVTPQASGTSLYLPNVETAP